MNDKILTISIAAYNVASVIDDCLASLVSSRYIDQLDIIVVDDGSKDDTPQHVESFVEKYPNSIRYVGKENGGHGSTINTSLKLAKGKYFKVIDGDDWVDTKEFDRLIEFLNQATEDLVLTDYDEVYSHSSTPVHVLPYLDRNIEYNLSSLINFDYLPMHAITVKLDTYLQKNEMISEHRFYVDTEFVYFVLSSINNFIITNGSVYQYRLDQPTQSVSSMGIFKHIEDLPYILLRLLGLYSKESNIDSDRSQILFNIIASRYKLLFYWFSIITDSSKDAILINFDKTVKKNYTSVYNRISIGKYALIRLNYSLGLAIVRAMRKLV
ncbi:glycosyltransferase family 2 protein [Veillonella agrestimuris]|uniref:glycosyltransferase family 2 protein n=1 Tax=Veillonella agrestimuris TaxID=2941340 RepID=UPI002041412F|nr:glycosyltransferase family 2 protein [Veillonella agrestimuris]